MSMFEVDLGDGTVVEVEAPDAKAAAAAARKFLDNKKAQAQPTGRSWGLDVALGGAGQSGKATNMPPITPRTAGLAGRIGVESAVEGPLAIPALIGDAAYNAGVFGYNRFVKPEDQAEYGMPVLNKLTEVSGTAADYLGLPQPETEGEKRASMLTKAGVSALTGAGAAKAGAKLVQSAAPRVASLFDIFASKPVTQATGSVVGTGVSDQLMQNNVPAEFAIPAGILAGGVGVPMVGTGITMTKGAVAPFTRRGQEQIVGNTMRSFTTDPNRAISLARTAPEFVPGSRPTFAEASQDPGLLGLQSGLMRDAEAGPQFGIRRGEQNVARVRALEDAAGMTPQQADTATAQLRDAANTAYTDMFGATSSGVPVNLKPLNDYVSSVMQSRSGVRLPTRQAMDFVRDELKLVAKNNDVGNLYSVRQNIAEAMQGTFKGTTKNREMGNIRLAKSELTKMLKVIDDEIERVSPGYKALQADYAEQIRPISGAREINEITETASTRGMPDPIHLRETLVPSKFARELQSRADEISKMTPEQQDTLQKVMRDLERSNAVNSPTIRAPGSDTFKNMSVASLISNALGGVNVTNTTARALMKPFSFIYKLQEDELRGLLADAMLDPTIGAKMLGKATPENVQSVAQFLRDGAVRNFLSTSSRALANQQDQQREEQQQ